jgi:hypothetical protein
MLNAVIFNLVKVLKMVAGYSVEILN